MRISRFTFSLILAPASIEGRTTPIFNVLRSAFCRFASALNHPCFSCIGLNEDACRVATALDGRCVWGKCDYQDDCPDEEADRIPICYTELPSGVSCSSISKEKQCDNSFESDVVGSDYACEWVSSTSTCQQCVYCFVIPLADPSRQLFALMEGEELEHHLQLYEKERPSRLGLCDVPTSLHYGKTVSTQECMDPTNEVQKSSKIISDNSNLDPWIKPSEERSNLIASDPGIWSIDNFLNDEDVDDILMLANKYGHDLKLFGPCRHETKDSLNAHPSEGKVCFKISPENVCDGPYGISECDVETDVEDALVVSALIDKVKNVWSTDLDPSPYAKYQLTTEGTAPMQMHYDKRAITFIMYLTDGGAGNIFPNANVTIVPKKGSAYTWLNYDRYGRRNPKADHAVQAHPESAGERLSVSFEIRGNPKELLASQLRFSEL